MSKLAWVTPKLEILKSLLVTHGTDQSALRENATTTNNNGVFTI